MHDAPSVSYPVGRSRFAAALLLAAWLVGASVTALWWAQSPSTGGRQWAAWWAVAASGVAAAWRWWRSPEGVLSWDGRSWSWSARGRVDAGLLQVSLDLQQFMLVRCACGNESHWLRLERA